MKNVTKCGEWLFMPQYIVLSALVTKTHGIISKTFTGEKYPARTVIMKTWKGHVYKSESILSKTNNSKIKSQ